MKKVLALLLLIGFFSCTENEEDYCNPECWTIINIKPTSIKIIQECTGNVERVFLQDTKMYDLEQVLCGDQVPL